MTYEIKKFEHLLGLTSFSDILLKNHFTLYEGYVKSVNSSTDRRRFGWEFNGMRLHELYFENLTKDLKEINKEGNLYKNLASTFGSYKNWLVDFKALGLIRGVGWVALVKDKVTGTLMNIWIGEHDTGHLANTEILLVMDVWEHAYMMDYGIKRADYIENFLKVINWEVVEKRCL